MYYFVAFWFSRPLSDDWKIQVPLFVCLVYNPFVFDFFVAARGYGLALALLLSPSPFRRAGSWVGQDRDARGGISSL